MRMGWPGQHTLADLEASATLGRHSHSAYEVKHGWSVNCIKRLISPKAHKRCCGCIGGRQMRKLQRTAPKTPARCLTGLQKVDDVCMRHCTLSQQQIAMEETTDTLNEELFRAFFPQECKGEERPAEQKISRGPPPVLTLERAPSPCQAEMPLTAYPNTC